MLSGSHLPARSIALVKGLGWGALIVGLVSQAFGQFSYSEDFKNSTAPGWNFFTGGTNPSPVLTSGATPNAADPESGDAYIDPNGQGWLRLATSTTGQANAVYFDTPIPSAGNEVTINFGANMWGGNGFGNTGADGLTFFLYDASQSFQPGAFGGSLGYAQKTGIDGLGGGFVGIAFDVYGNFSNPTEGRVGGVGFAPNAVVARGPGSDTTGYQYLAGTTGSNGTVGRDYTDTGSATALDAGDGVVPGLPYTMAYKDATERPNQSTQYRNVEISIDENTQITVRMQFGEDGLWYDVLNFDMSGFVRPEQLRIGFSAGTGDGTQVYEIGGLLQISATLGSGNFVWDNEEDGDLTNGVWGTGALNPLNWAGNTNPTLKSNVILNSSFIDRAQFVNLTGSDKVIKNLYFSGPNAYTLSTTENRKLIFDSDTPGGLTTISLTNDVAGNAAHTIGVDVQLNKTLDINNNITPTFTISGDINTNGNALNLKGAGTTVLSGGISGAGSLTKYDSGTTVLGGTTANTYTGSTTINGGVLQIEKATALGSTAAGTTVNTGGTLALAGAGTTFAAEALTVSGTGSANQGAIYNAAGNNTLTGSIALAGPTSIGTATGTTLTASGVISGTSTNGLTKTGAGTLVLAGTNTYTGSTTVNAGTLAISNENNLGANPASFNAAQLTLNGGTLRTQGSDVVIDDTNRGVTLGSSGGTFQTDTNLTIARPLAGSGDLTKTGAATLTLSGTNTHSGNVAVNAGNLTISGGAAIGNTSAVTLASGTTFNTTASNETIGSLAGAGNTSLGTRTLTLGGNNQSTTYSGVASGTGGGLTKTGTGNLTLTGANTFTGTTRIEAGTVTLGAANVFANSSTLQLAGGTFSVGGNHNDTIGTLSLTANSTLDFNNAASQLTFTNAVRTAGTLTIEDWAGAAFGGGPSQLIFTNTPTGFATGGSGQYTDINFNGWGSGAIRLATGEIVPFTGGTVYTYQLTGSGNWDVDNNWLDGTGTNPAADPGDYARNIGDTAILGNKATTNATLTLNGGNRTLGYLIANDDNTYTISGNSLVFDVSSGQAQLVNQNTGGLTINSGVTLNDALTVTQAGTGAITVNGAITGTNRDIVVGGTGTGNVTLAGAITTGSGSLTKSGASTLTLNGTNTFTGSTTVTGGTLAIRNENNLGANPGSAAADRLLINGGTLRTEVNAVTIDDTNRGVSFGANGATIDTVTNLTIANVVAGTGTLTKTGAGTLTLSGTGTNTHTGDVNVDAGTLAVAKTGGANRALGDNALVTVGAAGTLQFTGGQSETIGALAGAGSVTNTNATAITLTTGGNNQSTTFSGTLANSGGALSLTKTGTGTMTLTGANSQTGTTTVAAGTLIAANNTALGSNSGTASVTSGATLGIQGGITVASGRSLTLNGTGNGTNGALRNLSGNNTVNSAVTLGSASEIQSDAGTLTLGGNVTSANQNLTLDGAGNTTLTGVVGLGSGTVTKTGTGTATLTGANTYTGATTVSAGTLAITNNAALGTTAAGTTVANAATLAVSNNITTAETLTLSGQGVSNLGALRSTSGINTATGNITLAAESYVGVDTGTLTASGAISGTAGLTKVGAGTLILSGAGANTYTGTTAVREGVLEVQKSTALGGGANPTTVTDGATLRLNGNGLAVNETLTLAGTGAANAGALANTGGNNTLSGNIAMTAHSAIGAASGTTLTTSGTISGAFGLTKVGDGGLTVAGTSTYTGPTTVRAGTLTVATSAPSGANGALGNSTSTVHLGDTSSGSSSVALLTGGSGGVNVDRAIAVNNFGSGTTLGGSNTTGTNAFNGGITLSKDATLTAATGGTVAFNGAISGTGGLTKTGAGTVALTTANTYTGATTVAAGTLAISNAGALGTTAAGTTVNSGGALALQNNITLAAGETLSLAGTGVGGNGALTNVTGTNTVGGPVTLTGAATIGAQAGTLNVSGAISGAQALTTTGAGAINLTGTNTFSGATVLGGSGLVTLGNTGGGALSATSSVTVGSGAQLAFGASNQINDLADLILSGGTVFLNGQSEVMRNVSLTASTTSIIDYLNDGSQLRFTGSQTVGSGGTVTLENWAGNPATGSGAYGLLFNTQAEALAFENSVLFNGWAALGANAVVANGAFWEIVPIVSVREWNQTGGGSWTTNGNWDGGSNPNGANAIALFGNSINANSTASVSLTSNRTVGKLIFDSSSGRDYTVTGNIGTRRLTFDVTSGTTQLIVAGSGTNRIEVPVVYVNDDLTITNDSTATTGLTLTGTVDLRNGTNSDLNVTGSGNTVISGQIIDNTNGAALLKAGTGTLTLAGDNNFTGGTTLRNGTLVLAHANATGNAGTIVVNDAGTSAGNNTTLLIGTAGLTIDKAITVGATGATTTLGGLNTTGTTTFSGNISLAKDASLRAEAGGNVTFSGGLSGTGGLSKEGAGTVTLSGTTGNTFTGDVNVNAGTLVAAKSGAGVDALPGSTARGVFGDTSAVNIASGAAVVFNGSTDQVLEEIGSLSGAAGANLNVAQATALTLYTGQNNATTTYAGTLTDTGGNLSLVKQGTGTMTLSGANSYDGTTTVQAGTLVAASNTALGTTTGGTTVNVGATLGLAGNITVAAGETLSLAATAVPSATALSNLSGNNTFAGPVTLTGATGDDVRIAAAAGTQLTLSGAIGQSGGAKDLVTAGTGTIVLSGNNTYSGSTNVTAGTLVAASDNALGTTAAGTAVQIGASLAFQNNVNIGVGEAMTLYTTGTPTAASLRNLQDTNTVAGNITLSGGANTGAIINSNTGNLILSGAIGEAGNSNALTKTGAGTLTLSGSAANTLSGNFTVADGIVVAAKNANLNALGTGSLQIGDAIGSANSAVVRLGASNQINNNSDVTILSDGRLDLQTYSDTIGALTLTGGNVAGTGTLTVGNNITFNGTGSSTSTIASNLDLGGHRIIQVGNNGVNGDRDLTISGAISGSGNTLTKTDLGTLRLSGTTANTYSGGTTVADGTVELAKTAGVNALGTGNITVGDGSGPADSANLTWIASNQIADTARITLQDDGRLNLLNLHETIGSLAGSGEVAIGSGGLLVAGGDNTSTLFSGQLTGAGTFEKTGAGTLTLASNIVFDGTFELNSGTLLLNSIDFSVGTLRITGNSIIDFSNASGSVINATNFIMAPGASLTIVGWNEWVDYFYAQNWGTTDRDVGGSAPQNQITFDGYSPNQTNWKSYDNQITPVPEPRAFGALLTGFVLASIGLRRRRRA